MRRLALALALLALPAGAWAEEEVEPISPDRASASVSATTVGRGVLQLESGFAYLTERVGGAPTERTFRLEAGLRAGVTEHLELRIEGFPLVRVRGAADDTGNGDFLVGAKYRFLDAAEGSWRPALGVFPFVKLPVAEEPLGSGKTDFGALLLASFVLPAAFNLDLNAGMVAVGQRRPGGYLLEALAVAGLSRDVGESVSLFTDMAYASRAERRGRDSVLVDLGAVWRATRNVALDASAVTSLAGTGPDWAVRAGVSLRFGR
jgi:hypothetical protein